MLTDVRTVVFELQFLPYEWARPDGNPRRPDGFINLPLFELGKKIWSWSITGCHPERLLRRPDGCKLEPKLHDTEEGPDENPRRPDEWCLVCRASGRNGTSSGRLELWIDEHPDGMARRPDDCQGTDFSWLANSAETMEHFWIAESLLKNIFTYKWFCPIRMRPITN